MTISKDIVDKHENSDLNYICDKRCVRSHIVSPFRTDGEVYKPAKVFVFEDDSMMTLLCDNTVVKIN